MIKNIILDFDGTMCVLFNKSKLEKASAKIHEGLLPHGLNFSPEYDPFESFALIADLFPDGGLRRKINNIASNILASVEIESLEDAEIVPDLLDVIPVLYLNGFRIGIATNNAKSCVEAFMNMYLPDIPVYIVGRVGYHPELMKPNPWSLNKVIKHMGWSEKETLFIGDTLNDYSCCTQTRCRYFGMAHTEEKYERTLHYLSQDKIIKDYNDLLGILLNLSVALVT